MPRSSKTHRPNPRTPKHRTSQSRGSGRLRIIGGDWRGRKIDVVDAEGLRPTGERMRETLFNWLQAELPGSRCLDLFAGSGALGLEALSRGAAEVDFVDAQSAVADRLRTNLSVLAGEAGPGRGAVHCVDAEDFIRQARASNAAPYRVIFLDPPFAGHHHAAILRQLLDTGLLQARGRLYLEAPATPGSAGLKPRQVLAQASEAVERLADAPGLDAVMRDFGLDVQKCRRYGDVTALLLARCVPDGIGSH